jgi:hypothetical protein
MLHTATITDGLQAGGTMLHLFITIIIYLFSLLLLFICLFI